MLTGQYCKKFKTRQDKTRRDSQTYSNKKERSINPMSTKSLISVVKRQGFALVPIPSSTALQLEQSLNTFSANETFRFPPPEGFPYDKWSDGYKEVSSRLLYFNRIIVLRKILKYIHVVCACSWYLSHTRI
jgi:hypothetical protein